MIQAFNFIVRFIGLSNITSSSNEIIDSNFQSITGIKAIIDFEENSSANIHERANAKTIFTPFVLKRAIPLPLQSPLLQWILKNISEPGFNILPEVLIEVLNESEEPATVIKLRNVSLVSWSLGELNAEKSELLIEEIALAYTSLSIQ